MPTPGEVASRIAVFLKDRGESDRLAEALANLIADCYASGHDDMLSMADARAVLETYAAHAMGWG